MKRTTQSDNNTSLTPVSGQAGMNGRIVAGRQRNHDNWYLPPGLPSQAGCALWLAVACWGRQRGSAISRDDVARTFRISPRRAADVMTYLMNDRSDMVEIEKSIVRLGSGHRVAMYRIVTIAFRERARPEPPSCNTPARLPAREERHQQEELMAQARHLFLHQRRLTPGM